MADRRQLALAAQQRCWPPQQCAPSGGGSGGGAAAGTCLCIGNAASVATCVCVATQGPPAPRRRNYRQTVVKVNTVTFRRRVIQGVALRGGC